MKPAEVFTLYNAPAGTGHSIALAERRMFVELKCGGGSMAIRLRFDDESLGAPVAAPTPVAVGTCIDWLILEDRGVATVGSDKVAARWRGQRPAVERIAGVEVWVLSQGSLVVSAQ